MAATAGERGYRQTAYQIEVKDGMVAVPTGPWLGIEFLPEVVSGLKVVD